MSSYAIGNVRGRYQALTSLLQSIGFDPAQDQLWFSGDLVGAGTETDPVSVLRYVKSLGKTAISVLGDEELRLLAAAEGFIEHGQVYRAILNAADRDELLRWLRQLPFMHHDARLNTLMVHGGIPAEWSLSQARTFAIEVESALSFGGHRTFLANTHAKAPRRWNAKLRGWNRLQFISHAFTRMRDCNDKGYMDFGVKVPQTRPELEYVPWYRASQRQTTGIKILFSHRQTDVNDFYPNIYPLNTGAELVAMKLDGKPERFSLAID